MRREVFWWADYIAEELEVMFLLCCLTLSASSVSPVISGCDKDQGSFQTGISLLFQEHQGSFRGFRQACPAHGLHVAQHSSDDSHHGSGCAPPSSLAWCTASLSNNQTWCIANPVWAETGAQGAVQGWLKGWQIGLCILVHWLHTVLWTVKNRQLCFLLWSRNLRTAFRVAKKVWVFFGTFMTIFCQHKCTACRFSNVCVELQSDFQHKSDHVSLLDFHNPYLSREKYPSLHNHALFMSLLFGSTYICEVFFEDEA